MRKRRSASSCGYLGKAGPVLAVYSSLGLFPRPWIWMSGSAVKGVCGSPSVPEVASLYVSCTITIEGTVGAPRLYCPGIPVTSDSSQTARLWFSDSQSRAVLPRVRSSWHWRSTGTEYVVIISVEH